jgi:MinD-like ATPase involved in chromosome partitioning or flagellar assembly
MTTGRISVLVAASGAGWEAPALKALAVAGSGVVLLKRCVDLNDLLATASTGQARVAVVADELPGLDADSVDLLRRCGLGVVLVAGSSAVTEAGAARFRRFGVEYLVDGASLSSLVDDVLAAGADAPQPGAQVLAEPVDPVDEEPDPGRLVTVWGPTGAPGRTTVAVGLAAELAHRQVGSFVVDVDGFGGAVAQHLGVLDEMSGLLGAARLANAGQLDRERLATLARAVNPWLRVLTGLPRADRWVEVRESAFEQLLELSRSMAPYVVLDTAFSLEQDAMSFGSGAPQRNAMTLAALEHADEVVVVGSADPVGLSRLARGMVELLECVPGSSLRVVVNRSRPSLGWGEKEVRTMIEGFVIPESMHFLPEDRTAADRAIVAGKSLVEISDSPLRRAISGLADAVTGGRATPGRRRGRLRRRQVV